MPVTSEGGVGFVQRSSVTVAKDAIDPSISNLPIVKAVPPKSWAGPDLVWSGVPINKEIPGRGVGPPRVQSDVVDGLEVKLRSGSATKADAKKFSGVGVKGAGWDGEVVVRPGT